MSIEERVAELERRMDALEAMSHNPARPPSKRLTLTGFTAGEFVALSVGGSNSPSETPTGLAESANARGEVVFDLSSLRLDVVRPPDLRLLRGRGQRSGRVAETPVRDCGLTVR